MRYKRGMRLSIGARGQDARTNESGVLVDRSVHIAQVRPQRAQIHRACAVSLAQVRQHKRERRAVGTSSRNASQCRREA